MPNPGIPTLGSRLARLMIRCPERCTPFRSRVPAGRHAARVRRDVEGGKPVALITGNAGVRRAGAPRVGLSHSQMKGAHMHIPTRVAVAGAAAVALIGTLGVWGTAGAAPSARNQLPGSAPSWARPATAHGVTATSDKVGFRVYLDWRGGAAAAKLATAA